MQMAGEVSALDDSGRPKVLAKFAPSRSGWSIAARRGEAGSFELHVLPFSEFSVDDQLSFATLVGATQSIRIEHGTATKGSAKNLRAFFGL